MAKIIKFKPKTENPKPEETYAERIERIRASLDRINKLMAELKGMEKYNVNRN